VAKCAPVTPTSGSSSVAGALRSFRQHLAEAGLKFTGERRAIATSLFESDAHLEAEELLLRLRGSGSRVSRATVYRTLDLLVGAGLARKVRLGTDHNFFEHILGRRQHEHMVCIGCGQVTEWFDPKLARLVERNTKEQGFVAARYTVQVFGRCADCAQADSRQTAPGVG
jgi:Fur family ferric uptake transcriptional regulator